MSDRSLRLLVGGAALAGLAGLMVDAWPVLQLNAAVVRCVGRDGVSDACERVLDQSNPRAQYYAGMAAWHSGSAERALPLLRGSLAADPDNRATALMLGHATRAAGDAAGAIDIWRQAGAFPYFLQRARSRSSLDDAAVAVALDPASAPAHEVMGRILEGQGRLGEAAAAYRQAIAAAPGDVALTWLLTGHERRISGDGPGAVEAYQRAVDAAPSAIPALFLLAEAAVRQRDFKRAEAAYERVLALSPDHLPARLGLAEAWLTAGDTARARELFEQVATQVPQSGRASGYLGHIALERGDLTEAQRRLEEAVAREPQLGWAYALLGDVRRARGDTAGAIGAYRDAVRVDPSQTAAAEHLRLLEKR